MFLPASIIYFPAFGLLVLATTSSVIAFVWARYRKKPTPIRGWQWQVYAWLILALVYYGGYEPRLGGLAFRAETHQEGLIDFYTKYRAGGGVMVKDHSVMTWSAFDPKIRATDRFVEISWGATLPGSWGNRINNEGRDGPQFVTGTDAYAMGVSDRLTVFIGRY